jgi:hypothetical protein
MGDETKPPDGAERDLSPAGGPAWMLERERAVLDRDEAGVPAEPDGKGSGRSVLVYVGVLVALAVVFALVIVLVQALSS